MKQNDTGKVRALITGGTGYVGSHLVRGLLREGYEVHVVARPASPLALLEDVLPGLTVHTCALAGGLPAVLLQVRPAVVFHVAAMQPELATGDVGTLIQSNITFGTELVEAMLAAGCRRLVNTGTYWQHFEGCAYSPINLYAATKQAFADIVQYYVEARALAVITLKLFDTYGPRDPRPKLMCLLHEAAESGQALALSPGEQQLDLVYITDVVSAYLQAARLLLGEPPPVAEYAVSSGRPVSLRELVRVYEKATGRNLNIQWGAIGYRPRQVMVPWSGGLPPPGWGCAGALENRTKAP